MQNLAVLTPFDRTDAVVPQRKGNSTIFYKAGERCADFRSGTCLVAANAFAHKGHYTTKLCYLSTFFMLSVFGTKRLTCQGPPGGHCHCLRCSHPLRPSLADHASQDQTAGWWGGSTRTWVAEHVYYTRSSIPMGTGLQQLSFTALIEANRLSVLVPDNVCAGRPWTDKGGYTIANRDC